MNIIINFFVKSAKADLRKKLLSIRLRIRNNFFERDGCLKLSYMKNILKKSKGFLTRS